LPYGNIYLSIYLCPGNRNAETGRNTVVYSKYEIIHCITSELYKTPTHITHDSPDPSTQRSSLGAQ